MTALDTLACLDPSTNPAKGLSSTASASLLLAQNVPARVVMEILGHSQLAITTDLYSHVMPTALREAADAMDRVFVQPNRTVRTEPRCCQRCCQTCCLVWTSTGTMATMSR